MGFIKVKKKYIVTELHGSVWINIINEHSCFPTDDKDAALSYAKRFVSAIQAWSNSTLRSALSDDRTQEEKSDLVDEFFRKYEEHVAEDPEKHACDIVTANMHIEKM